MAAAGRLSRYTLRGPGLEGPGFELVERTAKTIGRYGMLASDGVGERVVVAVSGGADSVCLLDVLARLRATFGLSLAVVHVDHGLSPASADIAARVARQTAEAGFDVHVIRAPDLSGPNVQARARDFRYDFLGQIAEQLGAAPIATGHTLDDRVETTLARLIHGAGTEGLAGLPPRDGDRIRPLIGSRRAETRAYCRERGLPFVDDPANEDERFERVAIRKKLVRAIEARWGDGAVRAMAASIERVRADADFLEGLADTLFGQLAKHEGGGVAFSLDSLGPVPRALRRRLLERAVGRVRDRAAAIEAALDALDEARTGVRFSLPEGREIVIGADSVSIGDGRRD